MKESLGLEKKTMVSKALAESSNFGEKKPNFRSCPDAPGQLYLPGTYFPCPETFHLLHLPGTYHPLLRGLITPCPKSPTPVQLQMPSQLKNTQNVPPD